MTFSFGLPWNHQDPKRGQQAGDHQELSTKHSGTIGRNGETEIGGQRPEVRDQRAEGIRQRARWKKHKAGTETGPTLYGEVPNLPLSFV